MAWSLVGTVVHKNVASGDPDTAYSAAVSVDDIIDVWIGWSSGASETLSAMTDSLGNTYNEVTSCRIRNATDGQSSTVFVAKVTSAGTPTIQPDWGGSPNPRDNNALTISAWRGGDVSGSLTGSGNAATQDAVTAISPGSITPGANGALIIGSCQDVSVGSFTVTKKASATTLSDTDTTDGCFSQYEVQGTAGAYDSSFTGSANRDVISNVRSYPVAGGGGGGNAGWLVQGSLVQGSLIGGLVGR